MCFGALLSDDLIIRYPCITLEEQETVHKKLYKAFSFVC